VRGREALVKYVLRPPIAQERLTLMESELVRIELKRPFGDGTVAIELDPLSLLRRLAASVPPPRSHTVRYAGVLGAASKWRALVVPPLPEAVPGTTPNSASPPPNSASSPPCDSRPKKPPTHRSGYRPWAELMKRSFALDVETCTSCGGRMKIKALVTDRASIGRFLRHLGEPTDAPPMSPARGPPFWKSRVLRQKALGPHPQMEIGA